MPNSAFAAVLCRGWRAVRFHPCKTRSSLEVAANLWPRRGALEQVKGLLSLQLPTECCKASILLNAHRCGSLQLSWHRTYPNLTLHVARSWSSRPCGLLEARLSLLLYANSRGQANTAQLFQCSQGPQELSVWIAAGLSLSILVLGPQRFEFPGAPPVFRSSNSIVARAALPQQ